MSEELFVFFLQLVVGDDSDNGLSIGGMIGGLTGEELIDQQEHFFGGELFSVRDGSHGGHRKSNLFLNFGFDIRPRFDAFLNH